MAGEAHWAEEWFQKATVAWKGGRYEEASSAAAIASAAVFLQDAEAVADQARAEIAESMGQTVRGGALAIERMAEATRILQEARRTGPRHPAIYAALDALTGTSEAPEPRGVDLDGP